MSDEAKQNTPIEPDVADESAEPVVANEPAELITNEPNGLSAPAAPGTGDAPTTELPRPGLPNTEPVGAARPSAAPSTPGAPSEKGASFPDRRPPVAPSSLEKPRPRSGPIVWGTLVLAFCVYIGVRAAGGAVDTRNWIIITVLGLGALLLGVGIAVLVRSGRERR